MIRSDFGPPLDWDDPYSASRLVTLAPLIGI